MKKLLCVLFFLLFIGADAFCQPKSTLELYVAGATQKIQNGQEFVVNVTNPQIPARLLIDAKNTSAVSVNAWAHKVIRTVLPGTLNEFCWGETCYYPWDTVSLDAVNFGPNQTKLLVFDARYFSKSIVGEGKITYYMCVGPGFQDYSYFNIIFKYWPAGIENQAAQGKMVAVTSDPVGSRLTFTLVNPLPANSKITLRNILGLKVQELATDDAAVEYAMDIATLNEGIYIYSIESEGRIRQSGKMMIRH